jgi:hypothetical protein
MKETHELIYAQLKINVDPEINSSLVWVVYNLSGTVYKVFLEHEESEALNYKLQKEKEIKNGFTSNTSC